MGRGAFKGAVQVDNMNDAVDVTDEAAREIGKIRQQDSAGVLIDPLDDAEMQPVSAAAAGTGSANAATLDLGAYRTQATVSYDISGAADVTVEVSDDGGTTWYPYAFVSESAAATDSIDVPTGFQHVRAYVSANLNSLVVAGKGV